MKSVSHARVVAYGILLGTVSWLGLAPWSFVAAQSPQSDKVKPNGQSGAGEFLAYRDGKLTLRGKGGDLVWVNVGENFKTFERDEDGRATKPMGTANALSKLTAGMAVRVNVEKAEIYFGVDEQTHGTLVSYKAGKLTLIGRADELGDSFTKKYGTTLSPRIDPQTPVLESIDGGEFKQIGTAEVLSSVKEGTIVTLRGKNDTVALIQIGMRTKPTASKSEQKQAVDQQDKSGWGKFVSFQDSTLILESNAGDLIAWKQFGENSKTLTFDVQAGEKKRIEGTAAALNQVKAGTWVAVVNKKTAIYIGAAKGQVTGTFVSFKNDRLLLLGKDLGDNSFTRKYGNNLQFNRFREDVPIYESIDGGEYKQVGTANKILGEVKEGTLVTVHSEGDDNITLVQLGAPMKK